jgi:hypothetical protein
MKIIKYGTVTISEGSITIDGWLVTPEDSDPPEATSEQLMLALVIDWARKKFDAESNKASYQAIQRAIANPKAN